MGKKKQSNPAGDESNRLQRESTEKQYAYETKVHNFNWEGSPDDPKGAQWKKYNHGVENLQIQKNNAKRARDYQNASATQNWELGVAQQDYQYDQASRQFRKSEQIAGQQLTYNEAESKAALSREKAVLNEQFIDSAFKNQSLIQDLYEEVGGAGYDKAAQLLGLENTQGQLNHQKTQQLTRLNQAVGDAQFSEAGKKIQLIDKQGKTDINKANVVQSLAAKEAQNKFKKLELNIQSEAAKTRADFENDLLRREISDNKFKTSKVLTDARVKGMQQLGQAALTQAGRSQGKAVQMFLAELGREQAYTVESMIRGENVAHARMKQNRVEAINTQTDIEIKKASVDYDTLFNIGQAERDINEAERDLKITNQQGQLDLDAIRKKVSDTAETTRIDTKEISRNLRHAQKSTGTELSKIDWGVANTKSRFKHNQNVLRASLDSAVKASAANKRDIALAKVKADMSAEARRMLEPEKAPKIPKPITIPETQWQDPLAPSKPPAPIKGALARDVSGGQSILSPGNIIGAASAGLAAGSAVAGMHTAGTVGAGLATPIGAAVGLGMLLFG